VSGWALRDDHNNT